MQHTVFLGGWERLSTAFPSRLFRLPERCCCRRTFAANWPHAFTGTLANTFSLFMNIGIQTCFHLHPQRRLAALPLSPFQFLDLAQKDLCLGPDLVGAFSLLPVARLYLRLPLAVRPPPALTESFSPLPTERLVDLDIAFEMRAVNKVFEIAAPTVFGIQRFPISTQRSKHRFIPNDFSVFEEV